ncbi:MAG: recombinase [Amycolatopsis sp.]|uniref:recombinase family protein n=1 Tax=Amycolatopsis sp. TaxID=37632 RepID=UPI0026091230|nr:recombinase family protein [Amycolatopsis sp.]MCU1680188.1 recombinase [Amycolatopsis sp.]
MPANTQRVDPDDEVPRWAATAGRTSPAQRLAVRTTQLFRSQRRRRTDLRNPVGDELNTLPPVYPQTLRDYHAVNLTQARRASEDLVRAGFNTGAVPYGYRSQRARIALQGQRPRWRTRLVIEPVEAAVVKMVFMWRGMERLALEDIRKRLTESRYPPPLNHDTGQPGVWTSTALRAILHNPKYTGYQVWGRSHHGRQVPRDQWVWSSERAHPPLITAEEFATANSHSSATTPSDVRHGRAA